MNNPLGGLTSKVLFDAAADAMLLIDGSSHVVLTNPAVRQMLGYAEDEILGMQVEALMPARYRDGHRHHRDAYSSKPEKRSMGSGKNLVALTRNGDELMVDINLSPIQLDGQHFVLVTFYIADRRLQTEIALQTSDERLRIAKSAEGQGIFDSDLKYNIILCDERMREIWGIPPDEALTHANVLASIHPDDRQIGDAVMKDIYAPGGNDSFRVEYRVNNRTDGKEHWVFSVGKVFYEDDRPRWIVGIVQDITKRKHLEQRLQEQRAEMETLAKQQVAAQTASAIAHELNQPLTALSAYSEVALHLLASNNLDREKLSHVLEGNVAQAQRAGRSLNELLANLQKSEVEFEPNNLNDIVLEALDIANSSGFSGFHRKLQLEQNLPPVMCNRSQVQKVLVNLLSNGVEAMRGAGIPAASITIRVRTMKDLNVAQVTVQDSGAGLDSEVAKRVFEPFFTTKKNGFGMGLAISRALIEAMDGQLWLDPEAKPGATFHFTLPFAP